MLWHTNIQLLNTRVQVYIAYLHFWRKWLMIIDYDTLFAAFAGTVAIPTV